MASPKEGVMKKRLWVALLTLALVWGGDITCRG